MSVMDSSRSHFSTGVRLLALIVGMAVLLAFADRRWVEWLFAPQEPAIELLLEGQHYRVGSTAASGFVSLSQRHLDDGEAAGQRQAAALIERELDRVFAELSARLPLYADWHYSLAGEYARLSLLVLGPLGLAPEDLLADKAATLIFGGETEFRDRLGVVERVLDEALLAHLEAVRSGWVAEAIAFLGRDGQTANGRVVLAPIALDDMLGAVGGMHGEFVARISVSAAAGATAAAAPLIARVAGRPLATAGGRTMATRTALRGLAKVGGSAGGALGCAATGPGALPCAVLVGGATWGATDWLLLSADEWLHRDKLIAEWQASLDEMRRELETALLARYLNGLDAWHGGMRMQLERSFSPLQGALRH